MTEKFLIIIETVILSSGTTSGIMMLAFVMDIVVWHKAHRIDIDPESNSSETDFEKSIGVPESRATL